MATFRLRVITPEKTFFDDETEQVILRTTEGDIGIMAGHESYVANLPAGAMKIRVNGEYKIAAVAKGIVKVSHNKMVNVIVSAVEWAEDIDVERAKRAEENARKRIEQKKNDADFKHAEFKLQRALNRISVSSKFVK